jgi:hypothetical protein
MHLHYEAPESRTCSGCSHYGVNLQREAPPNKLGIPTREAFFNRILDTVLHCAPNLLDRRYHFLLTKLYWYLTS